MMKKMRRKQKIIAGMVLLGGIMIAAGVLLFPNILGIAPVIAKQNHQWTQSTGAGISAPACASASITSTCSGNQPLVTFNISGDDNPDGLETLYINYPNVVYSANTGAPAVHTIPLGVLANNTSYTYRMQDLFLDADNVPFTTPDCGSNNPPSANNLKAVQPDYCTSEPAAIYSWSFQDSGDSQSAYRVQVDNNSNFSSPEDDSGKVVSSSDSYATPLGKLSYNTTYYWRLMVWDSKDLSSDWVQGLSFTTPRHAYPTIDFSWTPLEPSQDEQTQFTDQSTVYGGATKSAWFWTFQDADSSNSTQQNPLVKFTSPGQKLVTLRVTDSDGFACQVSKTINASLPLPEWKEIPPF